jgi:hypothetical protein
MEAHPRSDNVHIGFVPPSWDEYIETIKAASSLCPCAKLILGSYDNSGGNIHILWLIATKITYKTIFDFSS